MTSKDSLAGSHARTIEALLEELSTSRPEVADELEALRAIFGESKLGLHPISAPRGHGEDGSIWLTLETSLPSHEDVEVAFIVTLQPSYPQSSPPRLQLSSKYIGDFATDSSLFGSITRTFLREDAWQEGEVAVFEGVERAREECDNFLTAKLAELDAKKAVDDHSTQEDLEYARQLQEEEDVAAATATLSRTTISEEAKLPEGCKLCTSDPIMDRKSVFIGHACKITSPHDVSKVVNYLLSDRKIAKAAHPAMLAYRVRGPGDVIHQDNDDDGESAAGSRLAHLLQILDLENVLVVVTRWYGGIHLGSDRFKHINQAARDALVAGGFVQAKGKR